MNKFSQVGKVLDIDTLYKTNRKINLIVIHCSATKPSHDFDAHDINAWHKKRWGSGIGYHYVITRDGTLQKGRYTDSTGAHAKGHNRGSIGICLMGGLNEKGVVENNLFEEVQLQKLKKLILKLREYYPKAKVLGHRQLKYTNKACPCMSDDVLALF